MIISLQHKFLIYILIINYKNVCKNATFSIQLTEKLPGNGYENGIKDNTMLEYRLQHEDSLMKTVHIVSTLMA